MIKLVFKWTIRAYTLLPALLLIFSFQSKPNLKPVPFFNFQQESRPPGFRFAVLSDQRYFTGPGTYDTDAYFRGAARALAAFGPVDFVISPGDIDPPAQSFWTLQQVLGSSIRWIPVVGNHELPGLGVESSPGANMVWLRNFDVGTVNPGPGGCPQTTFSFDDQNAHFVVLNEYCDLAGDTVTDGDIPDHLYEWLEQDLALHQRPFIYIIGHEPAYPSPDMLSGRLRHAEDSLNIHAENRDRFWNLLRASRVTAYICGHTHNYSRVQVEGVWQVDAGHARGAGDTGSASTMIVIDTGVAQAQMNTYRAVSSPDTYSLADSGLWLSRTMTYFPLISR